MTIIAILLGFTGVVFTVGGYQIFRAQEEGIGLIVLAVGIGLLFASGPLLKNASESTKGTYDWWKKNCYEKNDTTSDGCY